MSFYTYCQPNIIFGNLGRSLNGPLNRTERMEKVIDILIRIDTLDKKQYAVLSEEWGTSHNENIWKEVTEHHFNVV